MAAAGGFWVKGIFHRAAEVAVLGVTPAAATTATHAIAKYQQILPDNQRQHPDGWEQGDLTPQYDAWLDGLPSDTYKALQKYTGVIAYDLNSSLRNDEPLSPGMAFYDGQVSKALASAPALQSNATFWRGFGSEELYQRVASGSLKPGSQLVDKAYMSSSSSAAVASDVASAHAFPVVYRILAPKGTTGGGYLEAVTKESGQEEFLWQKGRAMTVLRARVVQFYGHKSAAVIDLIPTDML